VIPLASPKPKDKALYEKTKERTKKKFDVYPSVYANSWLVAEYKKAYKKKHGSDNAYEGKKPEKGGLPKWFEEEWVDLSRSDFEKDKWVECGRPDTGQTKADWKKKYPKCLPKAKAKKLWKEGGKKAWDSAVSRKQKAVSKKSYKGGKPTYVATKAAENLNSDESGIFGMRSGVLTEAGVVGASFFVVGAAMMQFERKGITDTRWWPYLGTFVAGASLHLIYEALGLNKKYCETAFHANEVHESESLKGKDMSYCKCGTKDEVGGFTCGQHCSRIRKDAEEKMPFGVHVQNHKTTSTVFYRRKPFRRFRGSRHREQAQSYANFMESKLKKNPRYFRYRSENFEAEGDRISKGLYCAGCGDGRRKLKLLDIYDDGYAELYCKYCEADHKNSGMPTIYVGDENYYLKKEGFEAEEKPTEVEVKRSTNKQKKLMAVFTYPDGKTTTTHFGARGMSDYTKHGDEERMERYLARHDNDREDWTDPTTAGALSRWILWNKPSLSASFNDFKKRFNLKGDLKVKKSAESFESDSNNPSADSYEIIIPDGDRVGYNIIKALDKDMIDWEQVEGKFRIINGEEVGYHIIKKLNKAGIDWFPMESFEAQFTPSQELSDYTPEELVESSAIDGYQPLKYSVVGNRAESFDAEMSCPPATQDAKINAKNQKEAFDKFGYGPRNVKEPGNFWKNMAKEMDKTVAEAKKSKCGNCVAFDVSPRMKDCGVGKKGDDGVFTGYCWMHHFTCQSERTCNTWAKGGPIQTNKDSEGWQERAFGAEELEKMFDGIKQAHKHYGYGGSHRTGSIVEDGVVVRSYSNNSGKDKVSENFEEISYRIKDDKLKDAFKENQNRNKDLRFFLKTKNNKVADLGMYEVKNVSEKNVKLEKKTAESFESETITFESFRGRWNAGQTREIEGVRVKKMWNGAFRLDFQGESTIIRDGIFYQINRSRTGRFSMGERDRQLNRELRRTGYSEKDEPDDMEAIIRWKHKIGGGRLVIRSPFRKAKQVFAGGLYRFRLPGQRYRGVFYPTNRGRTYRFVKRNGQASVGRFPNKNEAWLDIRYDSESFESQDTTSLSCGHTIVLGADDIHYGNSERPMTCPICVDNLRKYDE
jgi:hypothetical protein